MAHTTAAESIDGTFGSRAVRGGPVSARHRLLATFAWLSTLVSLSVYGFWQAVVPGEFDGLRLAQVLFVAALLVVTLAWPAVRPLRGFVAVLLTLHLITNYLHAFVAGTALSAGWFGAPDGHWLVSTFVDRLLKVGEVLVVVAVVLGLGTSRHDAFLSIGQLDAPARRVRWLGMRRDERWTQFGRNAAIVLGGVFALALAFMMPPSVEEVTRMLPLLPLALLVAAMNALYEEVLFRLAPLSQLFSVVGGRQAVLITVAYFGLGHYTGSIPSGPIGVVQAGFVGWILAKAVLETRGIAWPWFLHFVLDAVIFVFLATQVAQAA